MKLWLADNYSPILGDLLCGGRIKSINGVKYLTKATSPTSYDPPVSIIFNYAVNTIVKIIFSSFSKGMWKQETNNKKLPTRLSPMEGNRKKHTIQGDIKALLRKDCEVEKMIRFLIEIGIFEVI